MRGACKVPEIGYNILRLLRDAERWPSGRRRATRNRLSGAEPLRGFKSHPLRHFLCTFTGFALITRRSRFFMILVFPFHITFFDALESKYYPGFTPKIKRRAKQNRNSPMRSRSISSFIAMISSRAQVRMTIPFIYFLRAPLLYVERFFAARRREFAVNCGEFISGQFYRVRASVFRSVIWRRAARYRYGVSAAYRPGQ